ncbi:MAG: response regulator transcription factor [Ignavibacteriales bacterium]|nr:response regulator transcription factor [Ignavibacteriales bacterium]
MENKRLQVAIVDDSAIIRDRIADKISTIDGTEVAWLAEDLQDSFAAFRESSADAIILDIQLPSGSGIEFLEHVKQANKNVVVIMLTNYPINQFRKRCFDSGADYFFDKSTEFDKVFCVLRSLADKSENKNLIEGKI